MWGSRCFQRTALHAVAECVARTTVATCRWGLGGMLSMWFAGKLTCRFLHTLMYGWCIVGCMERLEGPVQAQKHNAACDELCCGYV